MRPWIFFLLSVALGSLSCSTSPEGRRQLTIVPDAKMEEMGRQSFDEIKRQTPTSRDQRKTGFVKCVASLIVRQIEKVDVGSWEILVFEDPKMINAFALPGRKIGVYTGILDVTENGGQLAAVLGHEVGHVIANHGNERVSEAFVEQGGLMIADQALNPNDQNHGLLMAALGAATQLVVALPHSRTQESEADIIGQNLMARAGFDPHESVSLWENMSKKAGATPPEWLSTHPANITRIKQLEDRMPFAFGVYQDSKFRDAASKCMK